MRSSSQRQQIENLILVLGRTITKPLKVYFTGGATAVMLGIRESNIDVDIKFEPDNEEMYRAIQRLKEKLNMNIELASPDNFIPPLPQWRERSLFIAQSGKVRFFHYDLYSQILAKVQRGWSQDLSDASGFVKENIDKKKVFFLFESIKNDFVKYPAINVKLLSVKLKKFFDEKNK